nr:hypothetical protein [uncultured Sulfurimonas sp.]
MSKDIENTANTFINNKTRLLKNTIEINKRTLNSVVKNNIFKRYLKTKQNKENTQALFEQIIASDNNIMQIRYINADGQEEIRFNRIEENYPYDMTNDSLLQNK